MLDATSLPLQQGVMIAWAAIEKLKIGLSDAVQPPLPVPDSFGRIKDPRPIDVRPRWPLGPDVSQSQ
jgi:hypothetical protein